MFIVTIGVLIALAINEWNNTRLEHAEEVSILERLLSDIQSDLTGYRLGLDILGRKEESLQRVRSALAAPQSMPGDPTQFLKDVISGANYGWNQHRARRVTFDELLGSGKLGLVRSADIRMAIGDYYESERGAAGRIDERETAYPYLSYQLVPREDESELDAGLGQSQIEALVAGIVESPLREHVTAEINFARFVQARFTERESACSALVNSLRIHLDATR
ncbi:MAG TPA: DUF6090 family protein [Woeseiaceae bacterium]|nr:DUF6090 family protein [Woeseiaceae bacterium]